MQVRNLLSNSLNSNLILSLSELRSGTNGECDEVGLTSPCYGFEETRGIRTS